MQHCWTAVSSGGSALAVLDALVAGGLAATPSFALAVLTDAGARLVVRGSATVRVEDEREIAASDHAVWADELLEPAPARMALLGGKPGFSEVQLPMGAGVTLAATIHLQSAGEKVLPAIEEPSSAETTPAERQPEPQAEPDTDTDADEAVSYDHLFGATTRPADLPQVEEPEPEPVHDIGSTASWHTQLPPAAVADPEPAAAEPTPPPPLQSSGLIDAVPGWGAPTGAPSPPPAPAAPPTQHTQTEPTVVDEPPEEVAHTVDRAALLRATAPAEASAAGPTVLAARCPAGHLSPAHSAHCRVCQQPVPEQPAFEVARPPLGVLRLSTGDTVTLDHGVLIGRAPSVPDNVAERPHLVRVSSPENDVSRNHAEVVLDGWHVFVRDLGSVNGTTVELPGQSPVRLREGDLQLLEAGSVITLADEVRCVYEVKA